MTVPMGGEGGAQSRDGDAPAPRERTYSAATSSQCLGNSGEPGSTWPARVAASTMIGLVAGVQSCGSNLESSRLSTASLTHT